MKTRIARGLDGEKFLMFWCPGCDQPHGPIVERVNPSRPLWSWNGDRDLPSLQPSILVTGKRTPTDEECTRILAGETVEIPDFICHSFLTSGRLQFLTDCTHALAGLTVDLPDWPWPDDES